MSPQELTAITEEVRRVAEVIQPQLAPHPGLARRNAYAHAWLGLKVVFGEDWRERAAPESVRAFLRWMEANPNGDYDEFEASGGQVRFLAPEERGQLF